MKPPYLERIPVRRREEVLIVPIQQIASIVADGELLHLTVQKQRHTITYRLNRTVAVFAMTVPGSAPRDPAQQPELVFTKIGNDYVLSRLVPADGGDREFVGPLHRGLHDSTAAAR